MKLARFELVSLTDNDEAAAFLTALCRDGAALLRPDPDDELAPVIKACYRACGKFFARPFVERANAGAGSGVGQRHGYMEYLDDAEGAECFEAKVHHDQRYIWPEQPRNFRCCVERARDLLAKSARVALLALAQALLLDVSHVMSLLDIDGTATGSGVSNLASASHSAMRVWQYTHGRPGGLHCDNTFLTVAPAGTAVGLQMRCPSSGRAYLPEAMMGTGELLVFAGDALSFLSAGQVPAAMHQVLPPVPHASSSSALAVAPRLSAPFFMRGRQDATLVSAACEVPPLTVAALEHNAGNVRSSWPWKQGAMAAYYSGQEWHFEPTRAAQ